MGHPEVTSLFPAKREVKREVRKAWQAWPGNQTLTRSLVRSLVGAGGRGGVGGGGERQKSGLPFGSKASPNRILIDPILPFS